MESSPINHRYDGIQALRFFAALLVVITHSTFYTMERLGAGGELWGSGVRGVDIFFVISGVVMIISSRRLIDNKDAWKTFVVKRIQRIMPLYWAATTLKVVTVLLISGVALHSDMDWWVILKSYFLIPSENLSGEIAPFLGVGWTLVYEMFFYLIFAAALFFRKNVYVFVGSALLLFSLASLLKGDSTSPFWFLMDPIILEFYMGMVIGYYTLKRKFLPTTVSLVAGSLALAYIILAGDPIDIATPRFIESGIPAAVAVWSVVSLERYIHGRVPQIVMFFGTASYALYLFHPLISPFAPVALNKLSIGSFSLSVLGSIAIAMIAASIIHLWVEVPMNNAIRNYNQRTSKKPQES